MGYVFISYSHEDRAFVTALCSSLRRQGIEYWRDIEKIQPPSVWDEVIHEALKNAERLIVVLSPDAMVSKEVAAEWKYALVHDIPIIPVYLRTSDIHYRLEPLQRIDIREIDFSSGHYEDNLKPLLDVLAQPIAAKTASNDVSNNNPEPHLTRLKHESWHVRLDAVDTLLKLGAGAGLLAVLQELLDDPHPCVRERISQGLPQLPSEGASREHQTIRVGTGVFERVSISDGLAPFSDDWLYNHHRNVQSIFIERLEQIFSNASQKAKHFKVRYNTQIAWFRVHWKGVSSYESVNTKITRIDFYHFQIRSKSIDWLGNIDIQLLKDNHKAKNQGFLCDALIRAGDEIYVDLIAEKFSYKDFLWHHHRISFRDFDPTTVTCSVILGPGLSYHFDSVVYRASSTQ